MNKRIIKKIVFCFILLLFVANYVSAQRFPKPEFETGHTQPAPTAPTPRALFFEYFDIAVLIAALSLTSYFALKRRSRQGIFWVSIFSLLYFGFWREGCVCSVGSLQNITLALFDKSYVVPITVIAFFAIPLLFALFTGRSFCAGVCPLGAIQDIVILFPTKLPTSVSTILGFIPYLYLGFAVLFAATGSTFIICRYDPFVGIFRFNADFQLFVLGATFLLVGVFIARPYCRFFCPYGVLLNWMSRLTNRHLTITPSTCIDCKLCEHSCPFDAIQKPTPAKLPETPAKGIRRLVLLFILLPVLTIGGAMLMRQLHETLATVHPEVRLTKSLIGSEKNAALTDSLEVTTFKSTGKAVNDLYSGVTQKIDQYKTGSTILGGFFGLVIGISLIAASVYRYRKGYTPNKGTCLSCARCIDYCPIKK